MAGPEDIRQIATNVVTHGVVGTSNDDIQTLAKDALEPDTPYCGYTMIEALTTAVSIGTVGAWEWLQAWTNADLTEDCPPPEDW